MTSTVHYLEMTSRDQFRPAEECSGLELKQVRDPLVNARLYREVGSPWQWTDRLVWSEADWQAWIDRPGVMTWLAEFEGREAGYVELEKQAQGDVEIVYFGLLATMLGQGLGGALVTRAVRRAWQIEGVRRIWLHTCSEDHPHALGNYHKRGFQTYRTETEKILP